MSQNFWTFNVPLQRYKYKEGMMYFNKKLNPSKNSVNKFNSKLLYNVGKRE